jgi:adenylate cyclase class 2
MNEIEVKILEINRNKVIETLSRLSAKKIFDSEIQTIFFDFNDGRIVKSKDVLRLRKEQDKTELTYKKVLATKSTKQAEETSVEVSNIETMKTILQNLGLIIVENMLKHRISYKIDNVRFDIDRYLGSYDFVPEFMEIEGEENEIKKYAELLGFKPKDCLPWSTYDIIQYYSKKKDFRRIGGLLLGSFMI